MRISQEITGVFAASHIISFKKSQTKIHWHDRFELCQVLDDNQCEFLVNGILVAANKGDIVVLPEKAIHSFNVKVDSTRIRVVQFPVKILLGSMLLISNLKHHITAEEIKSVPGLEKKLEFLFEIADNEPNSMNNNRNPIIESVISTICLLLIRSFSIKHIDKVSEYDRKVVYNVVEYINNNYKDDINIKKLADVFHFSRGRMAAIFKKYAGVGINDFINELRIENANYLLKKGVRINEAAFESGFQSIRTFNAIYKNFMGMTPTEFILKEKSHD